ncbi:uncharacterized protein [Typha latifolia]|uniref:uncharacterized protein n=1 Tax=Typha latifolia TaxID=4733 RepID=UPI003C300735
MSSSEGGDEARDCELKKDDMDKSTRSKQNTASGALQNGSRSTARKRVRKDWRAIANESGTARRRLLRSDVAKLRAEMEAVKRRVTHEGGNERQQDRTSFDLSEWNDLDWIKCGDDVEVAKKKVLKPNVVEQKDMALVHVKEVMEGPLRSAISKHDEAEVVIYQEAEADKKFVMLMTETYNDEKKDVEDADNMIEDLDMMEFAKGSYSVSKDTEEYYTRKGKDKRELSFEVHRNGSICMAVGSNKTKQINVGAEIISDMRAQVTLDVYGKMGQLEGVNDKVEPRNELITNNSSCKIYQAVECETIVEQGNKGLDRRREQDVDINDKKVEAHTDIVTEEATGNAGTDKKRSPVETTAGSDWQEGRMTTTPSSAIKQTECENNLKLEENNDRRLDISKHMNEVGTFGNEIKESASSGDNNKRKGSITSKRNAKLRIECEGGARVERRITRSAVAKQREITEHGKENVTEEAESDAKESRLDASNGEIEGEKAGSSKSKIRGSSEAASDTESSRKKIRRSFNCQQLQAEECTGKKLRFCALRDQRVTSIGKTFLDEKFMGLENKKHIRSIAKSGLVTRSSERTCMMSEENEPCSMDAEKQEIGTSHQRILRRHSKRGFFMVLTNKNKLGSPEKACTVGKDETKRHYLRQYPLSANRKDLVKSHKVKMESKSLSQQLEPLNLISSNGKGELQRTSSLEAPSLSKQKNAASKEQSMARQKVKDQIKDMLVNAGWKIDLRPRNGRNYEDSVYISPQGSGYWSITKAYDVFQSQNNFAHEEKGKRTSKSSSMTSKGNQYSIKGTDAASLPIPDELLSILKRTIVNKRSDKGLKRIKNRSNSKNSKNIHNTKYPKPKKSKNDSEDITGKIKENSNQYLNSKSPGLGRHKKRQGGCTLLVRQSNQTGTSTDSYAPYIWKRTILSWIIDLEIAPANTKAKYMDQNHTKSLLEGLITRDGISCSCCSKILSLSEFEIHAGSKLRQPYQNILVEEAGVYLSQCLLKAWEKQNGPEFQGFYFVNIDCDDPNDDTCGICGDGGALVCCDNCPSTFHMNCLGIQMLPPGDWHCINCLCRFCGVFSGCDAEEPLFACSQCEGKFHQTCVPELDLLSVSSNHSGISFCGQSCRKLFERLQSLLGIKNDLEAGFSWRLVQRFDEDSPKTIFGPDQRAECNPKIAMALAIMDECFLPIVDQRSGINLIHNVVYNCGSNFSRLNFRGFYTFILEQGDEVISAASLRIHGPRVAEMPFIGTRSMYRRQGMCRRLLHAIELMLCSLDVEKLIIPAISELMSTWINIFGFRPLEGSEKQEIRFISMLVFPGTGLLQKALSKKDSAEKSETSERADNVLPESEHYITPDVASETSISFAGDEPQASNEVVGKCKGDAIDTGPLDCLNSGNVIWHESSNASCASKFQVPENKSSNSIASEGSVLLAETFFRDNNVQAGKSHDGSSEHESNLVPAEAMQTSKARIGNAGDKREVLVVNDASRQQIYVCTSVDVVASTLKDSGAESSPSHLLDERTVISAP